MCFNIIIYIFYSILANKCFIWIINKVVNAFDIFLIFGYFINSLNPLYVERGKRKGGLSAALKQSLEEGQQRHLIFPEGTYTNGTRILQFKSGAFVPGQPVAPLAFHFPKYAPFWNRQESSLVVQIYRVLSRPFTPVTVRFLPMVFPSEKEKSNPKLYAENVRLLLSHTMNRPLSKYELTDSPNFQLDINNSQHQSLSG